MHVDTGGERVKPRCGATLLSTPPPLLSTPPPWAGRFCLRQSRVQAL